MLCDFTRPGISVEYQNEQTPEGTMTTVHNEKYFDGNRKAVITFSDLNLSMNESKFVVHFEDSSEKDITCNLNNSSDIDILKELKDVKRNNIFTNFISITTKFYQSIINSRIKLYLGIGLNLIHRYR